MDSERLTIRVELADGGDGAPTVQEVFTHVLELFELADDGSGVRWAFVSASTRSPLTIVAEARGAAPPEVVIANADRQIRQFVEDVDALQRGALPQPWRSGPKHATARRLLARSASVVRSTVIRSIHSDATRPPVEATITTAIAMPLVKAIDDGRVEEPRRTMPSQQMGSLDGTLVQVTRYYGHPSVLVRDRLSDEEVHCIVSEQDRERIASEASFNDVWGGRRVLVTGVLHYNNSGALTRITADSLRLFPSAPEPNFDELRDPDFTGGLDPVEYLDRLHGGTLGKP